MNNTNRKPIRGLQDIRTNSGKIDHLSHPHMAYMRISCLEMEKARKIKEKDSALRRIAIIDDRIREIEEEKRDIQRVMAEQEATQKQPCGCQNNRAPCENDIFKIRY